MLISRSIHRSLTILSLPFLLAACGHITPIAKVQNPPMTRIAGTVVDMEGESLTLKDDTGTMEVDIEDAKGICGLRLGQKIIVEGVLDSEGDEFEAYRVMNPKPCCNKGKEVPCHSKGTRKSVE